MIDYSELGKKVGNLVKEKQKAYGDSFNKSEIILKTLYPDGVSPENYKDLLTMVRIIDKLFRIATDKDAFGESPYGDIVGYALLGLGDSEKKKHERERENQEFNNINFLRADLGAVQNILKSLDPEKQKISYVTMKNREIELKDTLKREFNIDDEMEY